ncbi:lipopolysaccharide heptosyltransferase I [Candidatus Magnetaquicoccus inordinatus]|uniref:lipopolysaccharide heptosyltransferase I n=1 Tax=Candidatus Magnetaquicoccus inordinatus TaxID=2496818 RepID=UPI00102BDFCC|nr:lipopolysaccharide heptosyltransferase I [Candidatus Magnetaquicoccus inordinatus]
MMEKYLIIKTSSLGDVLHLLPALSDLRRYRPQLRFDWVVEEAFAEIPAWHPSVEQVIPVALRRWRKQPWLALWKGEPQRFWRSLRQQPYTGIIDAQGLLKSATLAALARGRRYGLDRRSLREPLAALFYQESHQVERTIHAVTRLRLLFSAIFGYPLPRTPADYALQRRFSSSSPQPFTWVFLPGSTWKSKLWPDAHWQSLARLAAAQGRILLPWGNIDELMRAKRIAAVAPEQIQVAPKASLSQLALWLAAAKAVVAVDTGPGHLAAAVGTPVIGLYGPTDPQRTGSVGAEQTLLQGSCEKLPCLSRICPLAHPAPCLHSLTPEQVWELLAAQSHC